MTEKPKKQGGQTRKTLIIEDLVILVVICLLAGFAFASSALLPISVTIVNCGAKNEMEESCLSDSRCCILLDEKRRRQKQKREKPSGTLDLDIPFEGQPAELQHE